MYVCMRMYVCVYMYRFYIQLYARTDSHRTKTVITIQMTKQVHRCIDTHVCERICVCTHMYINMYIHTYVYNMYINIITYYMCICRERGNVQKYCSGTQGPAWGQPSQAWRQTQDHSWQMWGGGGDSLNSGPICRFGSRAIDKP